MKYILPIIAVLSCFSCTKTKYVDKPIHDTVSTTLRDTVVTHDTTKIVFIPTLIGSWSDGNVANSQPTFSTDSMQWTGQPYFKYLTSHDSVYLYGNNHVVSTIYAYKLSGTNDTLWITEIWNPSHPTREFYRKN